MTTTQFNDDFRVLIGGSWADGANGTYPIINPATEEVVGEAPEASAQQAQDAAAAARDAFDKAYDFVLKSLFSARDAMRELTRLWNEHRGKVESGEVARVQGRSIHVDEDISKGLG